VMRDSAAERPAVAATMDALREVLRRPARA
jgi:hypothetical protein